MDAEIWLNKPKTERQALLAELPLSNPLFLDIVRAPAGWGVQASVGPHFHYAIFGRDSIVVAANLLDRNRDLAHEIIHTLARLQGNVFNAISEEEPGKIHHEHRTVEFNGVAIPQRSLDILRKLQQSWDPTKDDDEMTYYGSFDATPLFIRLVGDYVKLYGNAILDETYTDRSGHVGTIRGCVLFAAEWVAGKVRQRPDHLLAYKRINPRGIPNQAWKDSTTSYLFSDGSLPNPDAGIASVELQGYAYDALRYAASLDQSKAAEYNQLTNDIQRATLEKLWMPEDQCFAEGLGTEPSGEERQIDTLTSNAGLLLDSSLLADLPKETRKPYVKGVVSIMLSHQFRTAVGLRCRAVRHSGLLKYSDYHGSHVVWPRETFAIARGLERHGYQQEARELYATIVDAAQKAGEFYEFFYADDDGTVWYDPASAIEHFSIPNSGRPLNIPEPGQAWTISAAIASSYLLAETPTTEAFTSAEEPTPAIA